MSRAPVTSDTFNAIAEPQRRRILDLLKGDEQSVSEIATRLHLNQPSTSKHLKVLREVGLVYARRDGRRRLYGLDARHLRSVHEWSGSFAEYWAGTFDRLNEYVKQIQSEEEADDQP